MGLKSMENSQNVCPKNTFKPKRTRHSTFEQDEIDKMCQQTCYAKSGMQTRRVTSFRSFWPTSGRNHFRSSFRFHKILQNSQTGRDRRVLPLHTKWSNLGSAYQIIILLTLDGDSGRRFPLQVCYYAIKTVITRWEMDENWIENTNSKPRWPHRMVILLPIGGATCQQFPFPVSFTPSRSASNSKTVTHW